MRETAAAAIWSLICVQLFCDRIDCSPPGFSVQEISKARILELVAISFSRGSAQPRDRTCISCLAGRFFTTEPPGFPSDTEKVLTHVKRSPTNTSISWLKHWAFIQQQHIVSRHWQKSGHPTKRETKLCPQGGHNNAGADSSFCMGPPRLWSPPRAWRLHIIQGLVGQSKNFFSLRWNYSHIPQLSLLVKKRFQDAIYPCKSVSRSVMSDSRILEWVTIPFSKGSSWPRDQTWVSYNAGRFFTVWATREAPEKRFQDAISPSKTGPFNGKISTGGPG